MLTQEVLQYTHESPVSPTRVTVIAEFERDTLTERITDNMMELAKDGRWLGGNTPMGFTAQRVTTGSGKGKSAYSYLVSIPEEKKMVQRLYTLFRTNRSIQKTAKQMNLEGYRTPSGAEFNASTTRLVLRNPIYCTADRRSYDYFIDHEGNVFGDLLDFDGQHGLSAYNKTDQEKFEDTPGFAGGFLLPLRFVRAQRGGFLPLLPRANGRMEKISAPSAAWGENVMKGRCLSFLNKKEG